MGGGSCAAAAAARWSVRRKANDQSHCTGRVMAPRLTNCKQKQSSLRSEPIGEHLIVKCDRRTNSRRVLAAPCCRRSRSLSRRIVYQLCNKPPFNPRCCCCSSGRRSPSTCPQQPASLSVEQQCVSPLHFTAPGAAVAVGARLIKGLEQ